MKDKTKLGRLILLDLKRGLAQKIMLVIEIILCTLLIAVAFSGVAGGGQIDKLYKNLDGIYVESFLLEGMQYEDSVALGKQIVKENEVGEIRLQTFEWGADGLVILGYIDVMLQKVPIKLSKGSMFSNNYHTAEYTELILDSSYKSKFKVGQIVNGKELNVNSEENYKIIGFLQNNYGVLNHQYNITFKNVGIVKTIASEEITNKIIFCNDSKDTFIQKYGLQAYLNSETNGLRLYTTGEWKDWTSESFKQILSFFNMFTIIAFGVFFSTIMSALVVKYNDNLQFNKNMYKIGVTIKEFLIVKLVNVFAIALLCMVVTLTLLFGLIAPIVGKLLEFAIMSAGVAIGSIALVLLVYVIVELVEVYVMYKNIGREKK